MTPPSAHTPEGHYRATVEIWSGPRGVSEMLAAAGLGIVGAGSPQVLTISYKKGEVVDEGRVRRAIDALVDASEKERSAFKIFKYKITDLSFVIDQ